MSALAEQHQDTIISIAIPRPCPAMAQSLGESAEPSALKAELAARVAAMLEQRGGTQRQAAADLGISQPKISDLKNGKLRGISVEKLLDLMVRMGCVVEIRVDHPTTAKPLRVRLGHATH